MSCRKIVGKMGLGLGLVAMAGPALALEGGASVYPMGAENYFVGALPPPGFYALSYTEFYAANRFNGSDGRKLIPNFKLRAFAEAPRILAVAPVQILGASPFIAALVPAVTQGVNAAGRKGNTSGLQEVNLSQGLAWHLSPNIHVAIGVDEFLPFGNYSRSDLASTSLNRVTIEPVVAFTYTDPAGPQFDIKAMYDFNLKNKATNYKSGQDFHFDYALGWNLGNFTVGVGGYYERQITKDTLAGQAVNGDGFKIEGFAIGPNVQYKLGNILMRAKWQHEFIANNKPQGDAVWLSLALPL